MASPDTFAQLIDELVDFDALLDQELQGSTSCLASETQKEELKDVWEPLKREYRTLIRGPTLESTLLDRVKQQYRDAYRTYIRCVSKINDHHTASHGDFIPQTSSSPHIREHTPRSSFNLPPCEVETFTGEYSNWPPFRDLFTAVFVRNSRMEDIERLFHLRNKTKGEANDIVSKAPLTNEGFGIAWRNLSERYENKRLLVNNQVTILLNLSPVTTETSSAIRFLQREINGCLSVLQVMNVSTESWDPLLVNICSRNLTATTRSLWEASIVNQKEIPTWKDFDAFLTRRFHTLEALVEHDPKKSASTPAYRPNPRHSGHNATRAFQNSVESSGNTCKMCNSNAHALRRCPKFQAKGVHDRWELVKKWHLCFNCLAWNHSLKDCPSSNTCFKCKEKHNTLLHHETSSQREPQSARASSPDNQPSTSRGITHTLTTTIQSTAATNSIQRIHNGVGTQTKSILLGTALITIIRDGVRYSARALIDSGSEGTFITE